MKLITFVLSVAVGVVILSAIIKKPPPLHDAQIAVLGVLKESRYEILVKQSKVGDLNGGYAVCADPAYFYVHHLTVYAGNGIAKSIANDIAYTDANVSAADLQRACGM